MFSELSVIIHNIESGSHEQSTGIEQINLAVNQLSQVITKNSELVESFVDTGKKLNSNAVQLKELVGQFVTSSNDDSGKAGDPALHGFVKKKGENWEIKRKKQEESMQPEDMETADDFFSSSEGYEEF